MLLIEYLENLVHEKQIDHDRVLREWGAPIPNGMLALDGRGYFHPLTDSENARWQADRDGIIAESQKTLVVYQAALDKEQACLLASQSKR